MPITRWAAVTSSPSELRGFWTAIAFSPRLVSKGMTFAQQEPSANAPCTRTIVLIAMILLLELAFDRKLPTGWVWWSSSQDYLLFLKYAVGGLTTSRGLFLCVAHRQRSNSMIWCQAVTIVLTS